MKEKEIIRGTYDSSKFIKLVTFIICAIMICFPLTAIFNEEVVEMSSVWLVIFGFVILYFVELFILKSMFKSGEIIVTNKRIIKDNYKNRIDIPLDSITRIQMFDFKGISIVTQTGTIETYFITNQKDIYDSISNLLVERQK